MAELPEHWRWFPESRFGLFIHWGAYSLWGRGEQVLFREHLDQRAYADRACQWDPQHFDAAAWAAVGIEQDGPGSRVRIASPTTRGVAWKVAFARTAPAEGRPPADPDP